MNNAGYVLDTNSLSEAQKPQPDKGYLEWFSKVDEESLFTSCLSLGEVQKGITLLADGKRKQGLKLWIQRLIRDFDGRILNIDLEVALLWGDLVAKGRKLGRPSLGADALIAAQCIQNKLTLVTRNSKDFEQFEGLEVLNPWS